MQVFECMIQINTFIMCSTEIKRVMIIMYFVITITIASLMILFLVDVVNNKNKLDYLNSLTDPTQLDCPYGCSDLYPYTSNFSNECCDQFGFCILKSQCLSTEIDLLNLSETYHQFIITLVMLLIFIVVGVVLFIIRVRRHGYPLWCLKYARLIRECFRNRSQTYDNGPLINQQPQPENIWGSRIRVTGSLINNAQKRKLKSQFYRDAQQTCSICLMPFQYEKSIRLKCRHLFHSPCIRLWLATKKNCPNCRAVIQYE